MKTQTLDIRKTELVWLDAGQPMDLPDLADASGMETAELCELMEYGALTPLGSDEKAMRFSAAFVIPLRTASQLRRDFDLDLFTVALVLDYLGRINALEHPVRALQAAR